MNREPPKKMESPPRIKLVSVVPAAPPAFGPGGAELNDCGLSGAAPAVVAGA